MIRSFCCKETEKLFHGRFSTKLPQAIQRVAVKKLNMLHAAQTLDDLRIPPANRLEELRGDRTGQYSIRINDQWRICFVWNQGQVEQVEIVDYH
ncbi:MAG: type II toxin-antitoxin system RelE/ParE family toxin [Candidatus Contendobacter sp.]|nr:type II toxin-antitoxin system RelE/ParE family toxin [Candidatus Contendobacter sp.]